MSSQHPSYRQEDLANPSMASCRPACSSPNAPSSNRFLMFPSIHPPTGVRHTALAFSLCHFVSRTSAHTTLSRPFCLTRSTSRAPRSHFRPAHLPDETIHLQRPLALKTQSPIDNLATNDYYLPSFPRHCSYHRLRTQTLTSPLDRLSLDMLDSLRQRDQHRLRLRTVVSGGPAQNATAGAEPMHGGPFPLRRPVGSGGRRPSHGDVVQRASFWDRAAPLP